MTAAKLSLRPGTESCVMSGKFASEHPVSSPDPCSLSGIRKQRKVKRGKPRLPGPLFLPAEGTVKLTRNASTLSEVPRPEKPQIKPQSLELGTFDKAV